MSDLPTHELERTLAAPRELVWKTWTDPDLVSRWYGPNIETVVHRLDLKPGGLWLVEMRRDGRSSYQRVEYVEVKAPERLIWLHSTPTPTGISLLADDAGLAAHPADDRDV